MDSGEFREGDVEAIASGIFGYTCSSLIYRLKTNREVDVEKIYKEFVESVVRTLIKE